MEDKVGSVNKEEGATYFDFSMDKEKNGLENTHTEHIWKKSKNTMVFLEHYFFNKFIYCDKWK